MFNKYSLPVTLLILAIVSLITLKSIAPSLASTQLVFFLMGGAVFFITSLIRFKTFEEYGHIAYAGLGILLLLTLLIGQVTKGSARWIDIGGGFHIQASQLAVPIVALFLSKLMLKYKHFTLKRIGWLVLFAVLPGILIIVQPDLGTTLIYALSIGSMFFLAPIKFEYILYLSVAGIATLILSWFIILKPYQKERVLSFMNKSDQTETGWNAEQSLIAVGSGQMWGRGLGQGIQSHLKFLPERQTDFIFASVAEEVGFVGSVTLVGIYCYLMVIIWKIMASSKVLGQKQVCLSILSMMLIQTTTNIGMNAGLVPITGVTLPFVSYGGSSILAISFCLGLIQSILRHTEPSPIIVIT